MKKNPFGKSRTPDSPYATYKFDGWTWKVIKTYQRPDKEQGNPHARWFCFVTSPHCPSGEYGDTYVSKILNHAYLDSCLLAWLDNAYDHHATNVVNKRKEIMKQELISRYGNQILDIVEVL